MKYAPWIKRLLAQLLDMLVLVPFVVAFLVARAVFAGSPLLVAGLLALMGYGVLTVLNRCVTMGRTGWSWGKMLTGIRIVDEHTGKPTGIKRLVIREFVHVVDVITIVGMMLPLFPRWDRRGQLFADKIMKTVVIEQAWNRIQSRDAATADTGTATPAPRVLSADPAAVTVRPG